VIGFPVALGRQQGNMFLGRDIVGTRSEETAAAIDDEPQLVEVAYGRQRGVGNNHVLDQLAQRLRRETVDAEELQELLANNEGWLLAAHVGK